MKINLRAMMLASGLMISMIPFMPGEASAVDPENTATSQEKRGLMDITYMQEMAPNICTNSSENDTKQLIDQRDGKTYWVAKLKDGNCWMTQNLDLDLSTSTTLTSAKSDVSNWTPGYTTQTIPSGWGDTNLYQKSYDPGNYYYTTPSTQNQCTSNSTGLSACTSNGWKFNATNADISGLIDVTGWKVTYDTHFINATSYVGTDGQFICSKESGSMAGDSRYEQCRIYYHTYTEAYKHYHAGNYYSYAAATAGTAPNGAGTASSSICPKGWQLPTSNSTTASKSFGYLLAKYGLQSSVIAGSYDARLAPLYFVYGGVIANNLLYEASNRGYYWSSTAYDVNYAYYLDIDFSVYPSANWGGYHGLSVRCVARSDSSIPDNNNNVTINITPTLSLDVAATTEIPYTAGGVSTGNLSATVKSNQQHALQLSAAQPNLVNEADNSKIIPASAAVSAGTSAWGIKKKQSAESTPLGSTTDVLDYTALTSTPDIFYRSAAGSEGTASIDFTVGISTDSSVASGTYSTNVTVTATTI